jgi:uncharacterized membrane protein
MQLLLGRLLAALAAFLAYRARSLNKKGGLAATLTGAIVFGIGGWEWAILLLAFFITSSVLSRLFKNRKRGLNEKYSKGHERDAGQVFGNGGAATLLAAMHYFFPNELWPWLGFAAALAALLGARLVAVESRRASHGRPVLVAVAEGDLAAAAAAAERVWGDWFGAGEQGISPVV